MWLEGEKDIQCTIRKKKNTVHKHHLWGRYHTRLISFHKICLKFLNACQKLLWLHVCKLFLRGYACKLQVPIMQKNYKKTKILNIKIKAIRKGKCFLYLPKPNIYCLLSYCLANKRSLHDRSQCLEIPTLIGKKRETKITHHCHYEKISLKHPYICL